jgi:hypothetical protein
MGHQRFFGKSNSDSSSHEKAFPPFRIELAHRSIRLSTFLLTPWATAGESCGELAKFSLCDDNVNVSP